MIISYVHSVIITQLCETKHLRALGFLLLYIDDIILARSDKVEISIMSKHTFISTLSHAIWTPRYFLKIKFLFQPSQLALSHQNMSLTCSKKLEFLDAK